MAREITEHERQVAADMLARARTAMAEIADYDQARVDRLAQAIGWALGNETTFTRLAQMSVDESGAGDRDGRPAKRFKIHGILRDALRTPSVGIIETDDARGLVKYAKPAGVIASIVPMTNPELTPPGTAIYAIKAKDAVIFSPHPRTKKTTGEVTRILRDVMVREGAPADLFQCVAEPSIPLSQELMAICDMTLATGGPAMVKAAYSSGRPAFGVGAGNSTMVIDETADIEEAARNTRMSKTSDFGSGCSADGNILIDASIYDAFVDQLVAEGGYLADEEQKKLLEAAMWDENGARKVDTVAQPAPKLAAAAGFSIPDDRLFIIVEQDEIGPAHRFSGEKLTTLLAVYRCADWADTLDRVRRIYDVGGKGHSCGIYSFDDEHIDELARVAPVSRMMVRQPQSKANAGSFTNGMPMTSSLGCGIWGGNVTNENISLKHYLNVTWVSWPIAGGPAQRTGAVRGVLRHRRPMTRREFSLAYLSVAGSSPDEMIDVAAKTGYDHVSLRLTKVTADEEVPPLLTDAALVRRTREHAQQVGVGILDVELARVGPDRRRRRLRPDDGVRRRARRTVRAGPDSRPRSQAGDRQLRDVVRAGRAVRRRGRTRVPSLGADRRPRRRRRDRDGCRPTQRWHRRRHVALLPIDIDRRPDPRAAPIAVPVRAAVRCAALHAVHR